MGNAGFLDNENFSFWKNLVLFTIFFAVTPITIGISLFSLVHFSTKETVNSEYIPRSGAKVYASLPLVIPSVGAEVGVSDARPEIVRQYLNRYKSVLEPHAGYIVQIADKYGLDFRLIPAIAQQESNLCKIIPPESYNCWGWGIHSRGTLGFTSYEEGIETVASGLKKEYIDKGYTTVEKIMSKYTPSSNGSWANGVSQFMGEME